MKRRQQQDKIEGSEQSRTSLNKRINEQYNGCARAL